MSRTVAVSWRGGYSAHCSDELTKALGRLAIPTNGVAVNPLAVLTRDELERLTSGLLVMLGVVLGAGEGADPMTGHGQTVGR